MCRRAVWVLALLILASLLAGCWDRAEVEDQAYVIAMAVDKAPEGGLTVVAMVAVVQRLTGGGVGPAFTLGDVLAAERVTAQGSTITEAIYVLNGGMTRRLDLRHLSAVVVGEDLARAGLEPIVMELVRSPLARGGALLVQARGRASDVLAALRPVGEANPARMVEGYVMQAKQLHMAPPSRLQHFVTRLAAPGGDPFLPVLAINAGDTGAGGQGDTDLAASALPGELARAGGNPVEMVGTAVFRQDRLVGFLNVDETQMLLALRGGMGKAYISFPDPLTPGQKVTMRFHQENLPKLQAAFRGTAPRVQVRLLFEGEVLAVPGGRNYSEPKQQTALEQAAGGYAERTIATLAARLQEWQADPMGYGHLFRGYFRTWPEWQRYDWPQHVADLEVRAAVEMRIRRYGLKLGSDGADEG